jgi:hypothetical protein
MFPAVPAPDSVRTPVEARLKPGWRYDASRRKFVSESGETFSPAGELPKRSKIVYKIPALAAARAAGLTSAERDLQRYLQVILPAGESPADHLQAVRSWPSIEEAHVAPQVGLP